MSITLDDNAVDVLKLYNELTVVYSKDIDGYKSLVKAIEGMIAQKEKVLQDIRNKSIRLINCSLSSPDVSISRKPKPPLHRSTRKSSEAVAESWDVHQSSKAEMNSEVAPADDADVLKCLYHPESPAFDLGRQLCASCKWKLIHSGLVNFDKEPVVISYLKGEISKFPLLGQPMCPVHPKVPSYNRKTGLCKVCQKKAKAIGIQDRHLTEDELDLLQNPSL